MDEQAYRDAVGTLGALQHRNLREALELSGITEARSLSASLYMLPVLAPHMV